MELYRKKRAIGAFFLNGLELSERNDFDFNFG